MAGELLTQDGQVEWRGTLLGPGTYFRTGKDGIRGWYDLPGQRGSNSPLPGYHGSFPGRLTSAERIVEWDFLTKGVTLAGFPAAIDTLRRITSPGEDPQEEPLVIRLDGQSLLCWARVRNRAIPTNYQYALGHTRGSVQWEATDPRLYSPTEQTASTPLASGSSSGLDFSGGGLDFSSGGLDFGAPPTGGTLTAVNEGHVPTWPTLEVIGPCTGPSIVHSGHTLRFASGFVVLAGQTMVIDTRPTWRTVEINGVSVRQHLVVAEWAPFERGSTQVSFTAAAYDPASQLVARWRHAWH